MEMSCKVSLSLSTLIALVVLPLLSTALSMDEDALPLNVTLKKSDDKFEQKTVDDKTVLSIRSATGIGKVTIERKGSHWPQNLVLQLHLNGLEHLSFDNGHSVLNISVSSSEKDTKRRCRVWLNDKEQELLDSESPYWVVVQRSGSDGHPSKEITLSSGCFGIRIPKAYIQDSSKTITISWIDFYR